jgi:hypothetical protein
MAVKSGLVDPGEKLSFPPMSVQKLWRLSDRALAGLEVMKQAGMKMASDTDLLGALHVRQSSEFVRGRYFPPLIFFDLPVQQNAELIGQFGKLWQIF